MPSGSHSGGSRGGSHRSGGARSSSSYRSSSRISSRSSGSHHYSSRGVRSSSIGLGHYHRPMRLWWGRTYVIHNTGAASIISVLSGLFIFLLLVTILTGVFGIQGVDRDIMQIEADYRYYCDMIDASYDDSLRQVDAKVTGRFKSSTCDKWYLTYTIYTSLGEELDGFTYSMYTQEEALRYSIGDTIRCAVDSVPITLSTDSVNLDYKGALDRDGEYVAAKNTKSTIIAVVVVLCVIDFVLLVLIIRKIRKSAQLESDSKKLSTSMGVASKPVSKCPYCGTKAKDGARKCSNCGASIK